MDRDPPQGAGSDVGGDRLGAHLDAALQAEVVRAARGPRAPESDGVVQPDGAAVGVGVAVGHAASQIEGLHARASRGEPALHGDGLPGRHRPVPDDRDRSDHLLGPQRGGRAGREVVQGEWIDHVQDQVPRREPGSLQPRGDAQAPGGNHRIVAGVPHPLRLGPAVAESLSGHGTAAGPRAARQQHLFLGAVVPPAVAHRELDRLRTAQRDGEAERVADGLVEGPRGEGGIEPEGEHLGDAAPVAGDAGAGEDAAMEQVVLREAHLDPFLAVHGREHHPRAPHEVPRPGEPDERQAGAVAADGLVPQHQGLLEHEGADPGVEEEPPRRLDLDEQLVGAAPAPLAQGEAGVEHERQAVDPVDRLPELVLGVGLSRPQQGLRAHDGGRRLLGSLDGDLLDQEAGRLLRRLLAPGGKPAGEENEKDRERTQGHRGKLQRAAPSVLAEILAADRNRPGIRLPPKARVMPGARPLLAAKGNLKKGKRLSRSDEDRAPGPRSMETRLLPQKRMWKHTPVGRGGGDWRDVSRREAGRCRGR